MKHFSWLLCLCMLSCACKEPENLRLLFGGDLLLDRGVRLRIKLDSAEALFSGVDSLFHQADFGIVNLECAVTDTPSPILKRYIFRADPASLDAVQQAGITHLVMANNHTHDQGRAGIISTARHIKARGMEPIGYGHEQEQACQARILQKGNTRIAIFASVRLRLENWMFMPNQPSPCQASVTELCQSIREWKQIHPQDWVIISLHWGREFNQKPHPDQVRQAHELIDAGADIIIGHHPHVVQSIESYRGKYILYSIGNFVFDQHMRTADQCLLAQIDFRPKQEPKLQLIPLHIQDCRPEPMSKQAAQDFFKHLQAISPNISVSFDPQNALIQVH